MVAEASVVGVFRTLLILIGLFMVLRFFGRLATAKRNQDELNALDEETYNEDETKQIEERLESLGYL